MSFLFFIYCISGILLFTRCTSNKKQQNALNNVHNVKLDYAKYFKIDTCANKKYLTIFSPKDSTKILKRFTLVKRQPGQHLKKNEIAIPCKHMICLNSTQLAYFNELDALNNIVGIDGSHNLFNKKLNSKIKNKTIQKVGVQGVFNMETILSLKPDVIFASPFKRGGYGILEDLNIPIVPIAIYAENTPLGRAEWIKAMGLFIDKIDKADSIFNGIKTDYNRLKNLTKKVKYRPTVFNGKMTEGVWYVPENVFFTNYFRDAGANYILKNYHKNTKGMSIPMDYESIYNLAHNTDYWRLLVDSPNEFNKQALKKEDTRYSVFKAFNTGNILVCNLKETPYREESCIKPNVILADYIYQFHPELLPNYKPVFWKKIKT